LAQLVDQIGSEKGVESVKKVTIRSEQTQKAEAAARRFIAATFGPHQLRALLGDSSDMLTVQAALLIEDAISTLSIAGEFPNND
jgi:alkylhydroperoxidase family enzyme